MNVLYAAHYNESSGWGQAARDYILALDSVGVDVVPRPINLGLANFQVPDRIKELEQKDITKCNVIIQHVLPHYMKYDSHFRKNIGLFVMESKNIQHTQWVDHLNIMDELYVPCSDMLNMNGVDTPMFVAPHTFDMKDYSQKHLPLDIETLENKFVFYFIGQYNRRKHIGALLRAFHTEFDPNEPVEIVLKVNKNSMGAQELATEMTNFTTQIKSHLNLYKDLNHYKNETIITLDVSREDLLRLHASCDCFVCSSYGEAWCIPAFEAMAMSNVVVAADNGGPKDYIEHNVNGFLVKGSMEPVFGETDSLPGFGTARELEFDISISDLQKQMRKAYEINKDQSSKMRQKAKLTTEQYDYPIIGEKLKELISV